MMTTMDFLKSCRPNLYTVGDVTKTRFTIHTSQSSSGVEDILFALHALRQDGMLCAREGSKIVVFHMDEIREAHDLDRIGASLQARSTGFQLDTRGSIGDDLETAALSEETAVDLLETATDAATGIRLSKDPSIRRVAPRTWLIRDDVGGDSACLIRLRFHLTSTKALYVATTFDSTKLMACPLPLDTQAMLGPVGIVVKTISAESPGIVASPAWKEHVLRWLGRSSVHAEHFDSWSAVALSSGELVTWPSQLLFAPERKRHEVEAGTLLKQWFTSAEEVGGFLNPLTFAEDWFNRAADRENEAKTLRNAAENGTLAAAPDTVNPLATSPPFIQRVADQQAAMNGIYPTPPDGLLPVHQLQAQSDNAMQIDTGPSNPDVAVNMTAETPTEQNANTFAGDDTFPQETADLFGEDMGAIDFAGDIGDADFSFFDEPDDEAPPSIAADVAMEDAVVADEEHRLPDEDHEDVQRTETAEHLSPSLDAKMESGDTPAEAGILDATDLKSEMLPPPKPSEVPEKPLSPFGIKERLLPPPIPASAMQGDIPNGVRHHSRRSSTFEPVAFRDDLSLAARYTSTTPYAPSSQRGETRSAYDISLPPKRKRPRMKSRDQVESQVSDDDSESEEDSYDSDSSSSDDDLPPRLPWDHKKRKRASAQDSLPVDASHRGDEADDQGSPLSAARTLSLLESMRTHQVDFSQLQWTQSARPHDGVTTPTELFELSKMDIIYVAQIVAEQSLSALPAMASELDVSSLDFEDQCSAKWNSIQSAVDSVLAEQLTAQPVKDLGTLALIKEPPSRGLSAPGQPRPGQPRPHQRVDSASLGPDLFSMPPPYVKLRRGAERLELLPPALDFWDTLSLGPSNGPKDVRAYCVFPWNEELQRLVDAFLSDVSTSYESCKLGSHNHVRNIDEDLKMDDYEDGLAPVELNGESSLEAIFRAYRTVCVQLGTFLAHIGHEDSDPTFVVYMINPFRQVEATQHLCTCFWLLCKAYRDNVPKSNKRGPRSDVVLQMLPINLVASGDVPVICSPKQLATLAREVYDRCPPSQKEDADSGSRYLAAPAVELTNPPPKRIGFQLTADPPTDLMHEGSALHLSCAVSRDGSWLAATWIDTTGRYQRTQLFSLRGRSLGETIEEVWERTKDVLQSREVFWRIFILVNLELDSSIVAVWRKATERPRKQAFSVTFLTTHTDPLLRLLGPSPLVDDTTSTAIPGFMTPATTPGGTALTVSPDAGQTTAPPTPAPSDTAAAMADSDPDAHLIDLEDETWGVLFSQNFALSANAAERPLASGAIYKRGETGNESAVRPRSCYLPSLDVHLLWTIQVRPNGNVDDGHVKQAEMTLREVLKMYRNLNVLTRAKELVSGPDAAGLDTTAWPLHLVAASKAAEAVNGLLR